MFLLHISCMRFSIVLLLSCLRFIDSISVAPKLPEVY